MANNTRNIRHLLKVARFFGMTVSMLAVTTQIANASRSNNFTMMDPDGGLVGGANDVVASWSGTYNDEVTDTDFNVEISSETPFFGFLWSAHDIRLFGPGTYTFDSSCTVAQVQAGTAVCDGGPFLSMTVGPGQVGMHILFDWSTALNIDVVNVYDIHVPFDPGPNGEGMYLGAIQGPAPWAADPATPWSFTSTDNDGNGIAGVSMVDGPFVGFNANFNLHVNSTGDSTGGGGGDFDTIRMNVDGPDSGCSIQPPGKKITSRLEWILLIGFLVYLGVRRRKACSQ